MNSDKDSEKTVNCDSPRGGTPVHGNDEPPFIRALNASSPQQIPASSSKRTEKRTDPSAAEETAFSAAACPLDPWVLDRPIPRRGLALLVEAGVDEPIARVFAHEHSFRRIYDVTARATSFPARNPGGFVRQLLERGGPVPPALTGEEERRILMDLAAETRALDESLKAKPTLKAIRLPGESDEDWLRRVEGQAKKRMAQRSR
ncbi:MAG: hypothetical protein HY716_10885 [Planctomycetes bacterium]|nr:hypothetical protein [Planctomycetota bacterium]